MGEIDEDIKATAGAIVGDAAVITGIADEKLGLDDDDPRVVELSAEAEEVASRLLQKAEIQHELATEAHAEAKEVNSSSD